MFNVKLNMSFRVASPDVGKIVRSSRWGQAYTFRKLLTPTGIWTIWHLHSCMRFNDQLVLWASGFKKWKVILIGGLFTGIGGIGMEAIAATLRFSWRNFLLRLKKGSPEIDQGITGKFWTILPGNVHRFPVVILHDRSIKDTYIDYFYWTNFCLAEWNALFGLDEVHFHSKIMMGSNKDCMSKLNWNMKFSDT